MAGVPTRRLIFQTADRGELDHSGVATPIEDFAGHRVCDADQPQAMISGSPSLIHPMAVIETSVPATGEGSGI